MGRSLDFIRRVRKWYGWRREGPRNKKNKHTKNTNAQSKGGGERQRGKGRKPKPPRSQNLFAADFPTIADQKKDVLAITDICIETSSRKNRPDMNRLTLCAIYVGRLNTAHCKELDTSRIEGIGGTGHQLDK
jgi:hypothetical protein